jgi:N-acetylneuraminic acid mutarotase
VEGTVLLLGLACLIAAIVGGGLKMAKVEIPLISSPLRQAILAVVGIVLVAVSLGPAPSPPPRPDKAQGLRRSDFVGRLVKMCAEVNRRLAAIAPEEDPGIFAEVLDGFVVNAEAQPAPEDGGEELDRLLVQMKEAVKSFTEAQAAATAGNQQEKEAAVEQAKERMEAANTAAQQYGMPPLENCDEVVAGQSGSQWRALRNAPVARQQVATVVADGTIWVFGGLEENNATSKTAGYDPAIDTWKAGPDLPIPLHHAMAVVYRGELVVLGGWQPQASNLQAITSDRVFALRQGNWVELPKLNRPRAAGAAAVVGDKIVVVGGQANGELIAATSVFDGRRWRDGANIPTPREHLAAASDGTALFAVGGRLLSADKNVAALERYDVATNRWQQLPAMPSARGGLGAAVVDGRLVAVGGEHPTGVFGNVEAFDIGSSTWSELPSLGKPRHGLAVAAVGNELYALNGAERPSHANSSPASEVLVFS